MEPQHLIVLEGLEGNEPTHLSALQTFFSAHMGVFKTLWWIVLCLTLFLVLREVYRQYRDRAR